MSETLSVGQQVKVMTQNETWDGSVVTIGRKWVTIRNRYGRSARFDVATRQSQGPSSQYLYTLDEWADRGRAIEAEKFLRGQGIRVELGSSWAGRRLELAQLISKYIEDKESS